MRELAHDLLSAEFWRSHLLAIGYIGIGMLVFVVFLAADFPYGQALTSMLAPLNLALTYTDHHARLPIGTELDGVRLSNTLMPGAPPLLDGANVTLAPALGSLLLGRPGIHLEAELYGGFVSLVLYRISHGVGVGMDASSLDLSRYDELVRMGVNARGFLSGRGSGSLPNLDPMLGSGQVHLKLTHFTLRVIRGLPTLRFGDLDGSAHVEGGVVTVDSLDAAGGDFTVSASGTIRLAADLPDSLIDLRVKLEPTPSGRRRLGPLFQMLPHPPGAQPYLVRGRLAAPQIS
ncbi:MAG TPA: type II secretion system protein GspN [Candidatus Binataceae bacterium]|nr:type II secretion system protein GspN [Candidatus Binataceae bacterium]